MTRLLAAVLILAAAAVATGAHAQSLTDDPAFALYREAAKAADAKDFERATQLAKEAIAQYPDHVLAWDLLGQAAMGRSAWREAVDAFANVTKRYPKSFAAHRDLGLALANLGRQDEAKREFEAALALRPDSDDTRLRLASLYDRGQRDIAVPMLETLARGNNPTPEVWLLLGRTYYERNDLPACEKAFTKAAALQDDGKIWFNLGVVRVRLRDFTGAQAAFKRAAEHPEVRQEANRELDKIREALRLGTK
jgi:cytochrome c-type biogenesis protein CcmH/NrfG